MYNESTKVHNPRRNQSTGKYTEIWPTSRFGSKVACYPLMLRGIALSCSFRCVHSENGICIRSFIHILPYQYVVRYGIQ